MGKFRSKLKRHSKGKTWSKGHSSTSNPEQMKHRNKAKSRFFQPNISLAPPEAERNPNTLTLEAVMKHEQRQAFNAETTTVNDVAGSLKSFSLHDDDELMSESQGGTFKTFKTFASNYSTCSNMSFKKLLVGFRASSDFHKEMLAILTALTEIIKERGGTESSTEYFILLMEQIEASTEDNDIIAGVSLLSMGIKSVPAAVLRKRFSETAGTLMSCLQRFMDSNNQSIIKYVIGCLSVLLRAQDYMTWTYSSTWQYMDALLSFTIHSKPKIRKAAQHAVVSIIHGSSFMLPPKPADNEEENETPVDTSNQLPQIKFHPAGSRVTKFCLNQFKPEVLAQQQTTVLHTLALLKETISGFKTDDIRTVCEHLLSIMTAANVLVRTNCLQTMHQLFVSRTTNLNGLLCAKLLTAIHEYRPDRTDYRQTLAWLTVLKEGHIHLSQLELNLCINALPSFVEICCSDLWLSDRTDIIVGVSNAIKELLYECFKPACATQELANVYRVPITKILSSVHKVLSAPFGEVAKYVVLTFSIIFEVCGTYYSKELSASLLELAKRYDTQSALRIQIEHAIISAIKAMGPEIVLKSIPLTNTKGEVLLEKSWLLPLLREGAAGASFKFFKEVILALALDCNKKWHKFADEKQVSMSHTYELLCCQLWGLFPGFCRAPKDPDNFKLIAPTLGNALDNNPEFRAPIFDGLIELIQNEEQTVIHEALGKYAKNFLPRLFNIYTQKPNGTYEQDLRKKSLEVIKLYLTKTPNDMLKELFDTAHKQLEGTAVGTFEYDSIFDITAALVLFQTCEVIRSFFETYIVPVLMKSEKSKLVTKDEQKLKKQQRKTYELLRDILTSEAASCKKFTRTNLIALQKLLLEAFSTSCAVCQAARLRCLKILIENRKNNSITDKIIIKTLPEAVINYKEFSTRKENISEELLKLILDLYQEAEKLNDFVDILTAGFAGDESLITNTILAFRTVVQSQGKNLTVSTLEFIMEQIAVFLVQKSRSQAEASVAFLITFIKVMPAPLVANHLETIMKSLSAMVKDTKRFCRIQIGYLLKKLCKRFTAEELIRFVPGDDEVTHRRLKKIRKQLRRENRKKQSEGNAKDSDEEGSDEEFVPGLEKKSVTIDDILADSDSDLPEDMDDDDDHNAADKSKNKKQRNTFIREDPEDIVDLADIKSIGNVLTNRPNLDAAKSGGKTKSSDPNRGFKTAEDGRLIISDKALRGMDDDEGDSSSDDDDDEGVEMNEKKAVKRGMEDDSSDDEDVGAIAPSRKRKAADALSMRSGKTSASRYTTGGKGIHRNVGAASDAISMKSGKSGYSTKSGKSNHTGGEYTTKKAKGDMKKKGKLDPYAYIPLSRNTLNKRKRAKHAGAFKNIVNGARKGALKGVKSKMAKAYKK
ncbi:RRP12-like protein [Lucilia cuprina]|uniref:RRP12-like protein n=1 Tax=Lucilia cuprina TaxID=7375 RepID=A0A0L0C2M7_LUCCU|nr:RRP12-like protein [Lucilia cuprina]